NPRFGPGHAPAVSAGNVETSQAIVDALIEAFGLAAHSQGTMNNLAFGPVGGGEGEPLFPSFYETLGGGAGATPGVPPPSRGGEAEQAPDDDAAPPEAQGG